MSDTSVVPTKCPPLHSTRRPRSISSAQCVCAVVQRWRALRVLEDKCVQLRLWVLWVRASSTNKLSISCTMLFYHFLFLATQEGRMRCIPCPVWFYCPQERDAKIQQTITKCPLQTTSHPATASLNGYFCEQSDRNLMASTVPSFALRCLCASSHYESGINSRCIPSPKNMFVSVQSMLSSTQPSPMLACACVSGFYAREMVIDNDNSEMQCTVCPVGISVKRAKLVPDRVSVPLAHSGWLLDRVVYADVQRVRSLYKHLHKITLENTTIQCRHHKLPQTHSRTSHMALWLIASRRILPFIPIASWISTCAPLCLSCSPATDLLLQSCAFSGIVWQRWTPYRPWVGSNIA